MKHPSTYIFCFGNKTKQLRRPALHVHRYRSKQNWILLFHSDDKGSVHLGMVAIQHTKWVSLLALVILVKSPLKCSFPKTCDLIYVDDGGQHQVQCRPPERNGSSGVYIVDIISLASVLCRICMHGSSMSSQRVLHKLQELLHVEHSTPNLTITSPQGD